MRKGVALSALLLLASCNGEGAPPTIAVESAWARATVPGQTATAGYFTLVNSGGEDRLLSVSSPTADASLHSTTMHSGVARMRPVEALEIPAGGTVQLEPGGNHVMLIGLKQPLEAGATVPLNLRFERSGERQVQLQVRSASGEAM